MAAVNPKNHLLDTLKRDAEVVGVEGGEQIFLTPYLALACSLLYMMDSDGELEAAESSQLQSVLGGDQAVLNYALRYVQSVPVAQFFASACEILSVRDKWCILTNVCDALLSDGRVDRAELVLFSQMSAAFGVGQSQFEPYFKILALKNDKSVLGKYGGVKSERQPMTPHFALAIALLYMLTADGSIGAQEVGQLEAVIGEFEGLQSVALAYVRTTKLKQFLDEAAALLKPEQKIYILANVCDCMLSDGEVARLEDKLFLSMLTAFGFTERTFARYLKVLETKNLKPFDTRAFKNHVQHERVSGAEEGDGLTFTNELSVEVNSGVWVAGAGDAKMSQFIARTMDDNIQSVSDGFENQSNVVNVGLNATDGLNLQKLDGDAATDNRQQVAGLNFSDHLEKIDNASGYANRQQIDVSAGLANRQTLDSDGFDTNWQAVVIDRVDSHREVITPEVRAQNIHEVVEAVHHRLDRFETDHFSFLQIGRAQKFTDAFVLLDDDDSEINRQLVDESYLRMGLADASKDHSLSVQELGGQSMQEPVSPAADQSDAQAVSSASAAVEHSNAHDDVSSPKFTGLRLFRGKANLHVRGFTYVQWVVASVTIAFAAPIASHADFSRVVTGPLIAAPVVLPVLDDSSVDETLELADLKRGVR